MTEAWNGVTIVKYRRKMSTFVNGLIQAGLVVEQMLETEPDQQVTSATMEDPSTWYSAARAALIPTTFIITARKPSTP